MQPKYNNDLAYYQKLIVALIMVMQGFICDFFLQLINYISTLTNHTTLVQFCIV